MSFFKGGATGTEQAQNSQNQGYIYGQGGALSQQAQNQGQQYNQQAQAATQQANQAYAPLIAGQGGYSPDQAAAIENQQGLSNLQLTPDQKAAITGNPNAGATSWDTLNSNYLTAGDANAIKGDQSGINAGLGQVNAAVDPNSVNTFTNNTRLTQQGQDQIATDAARSATNVDHATMDANAEAARRSGADPLGVSSMTDRENRAASQDAANAASSARVNAMQVAAGREQNILGANQTLAAQKAGAANTNLSAQQGMEANQSARAQSMALNRQATDQSNSATLFNQQQQANQNATAAAANIAQNQQAMGQYIDTNQSGRAATVANQQQATAAEGRNYLQNQIAGNTQGQLTEAGIQSGVYGTQSGAGVNNANSLVAANQRQSGFNQFLGAASGGAGAAANAYANRPSVYGG